ncbi:MULTISPECIES: helix-turn-helix domain-containing protein [Micrococcales]|jgi:excisionase family DNA binding protein|uniref:helix-turn-helix domain-containing protein n=1 Tax=Micrococcales TaxID=85006 RepID=UPI00130E7ECF|nr:MULTISPECIES: helix-turn-helix domain-containing protein [Micrococcales]MCG7285822.1 helix-turn-helix domain-containing protein [Cellulomonas sp. ACRRI]
MTSEQPPRVRFLTVAEVAEVMRVSKMTVYRLLHSGEMPAVRVGRSFRVPQDALDHYLATARLDLEAEGEAGEDGPRAGRLSS